MQVHNFEAQKAFSRSQSDQNFWFRVYEKAFPGLASAVSVIDGEHWAQRAGVDRILTLDHGRVITVDEKVRKVARDDILLEYWSNREKKGRGWIAKDLGCDYIAYAFLPTRKCYLFPFLDLRRAWRDNHKEWIGTYGKCEARNPGYISEGCPVPIRVVQDALIASQVIEWD